MRRQALATALVLILGACTSAETAGDTAASSTTTAAPTTTTLAPTTTAGPDEVCDQLKLAVFDLESGMSGLFTGLAGLDEAQVDEEALGRDMLAGFAAFFERLSDIASSAPAAVAEDLATIASVSEGLRTALESDEPLGDAAPPGLDPADPDPEVEAAATRLAEWTERRCGTAISLDPAELLLSTTMSAAFAAFGDALGELGDAFGDAFGEGLSDLEDLDGLGTLSDALVYGDDPELDGLWDGCGAGDGEACEELWFSGYGEYETFAQTCGGTIPFLAAFHVDCSGKLDPSGPDAHGEDPFLDDLWDRCESGDASSCDSLAGSAPAGSTYEAFGRSCGDTRPVSEPRPCAFAESGEPFSYGDDPELDGLWDACSVGDAGACSDLYFDTPFDSAYERFGSACGDLVAAGATCERLAGWLGGPVG